MVQTFDDPAQTIHVARGETFVITLAGNPTTGYQWQADVDLHHLELLDQEFEPGGKAIGAGGWQVFHFQALGAGQTKVAFEYRRPWGGEARDTQQFRVVIS